MKLLHLSDLHLTEPFKNFSEVWLPVRTALGAQSFDAVIVSGDLTQAAQPAEYDRLEAFLIAEVLPLVGNKREAVVLLPGNHDVDWKADTATRVSLASLDPARIATIVREANHPPGENRYRTLVGPHGHFEVFELAPERYPSRFTQCQAFLDRFYASVPQHNRVFELLGGESAQWSAHLFPKHGVAIYGFNSAFSNDRYWTGATLSAEAANQAARHAQAHAADFLRVAAWHHGLTSEKGRSDLVSMAELGHLFHAGFRVGLHGHTHKDEARLLEEFLSDRFAVIATGSLGAGPPERPGAVGNQFSIIDLHPGQVRVQLLERREHSYELQTVRHLRLPRTSVSAATTSADAHHRTWVVNTQNGIVSCRVRFDGLRGPGRVVLARPIEPHGHAIADPTFSTPTGKLAVQCESVGSGAQRFSIHVDDEPIRTGTWSYRVSNSVALTLEDKRRSAEPVEPNIEPNEELFSHLVRLQCDRLRLRVEFDGPRGSSIFTTARALVEYQTERDGEPTRAIDPAETDRCAITPEANAITVEVEAPLVGHRYSIVFALRDEGFRTEVEIAAAVTNTLQTCRLHPAAEQVRERMAAAVHQAVDLQLPNDATWICLLWSAERQRLVPACGDFPVPSWSVRFPNGEGVAGHAFRFGKPAFWTEGANGEHSLVYRALTELGGPFLKQYEWICCFPILTGTGCPVGVVSFAGHRSVDPSARALERMAEEICAGGKSLDGEASRLWDAVNRGFWKALAEEAEADPRTRAFAAAILKQRAES